MQYSILIECYARLDWSRRIGLSSSSQVFDSNRVKSVSKVGIEKSIQFLILELLN